MVLTEVRRGNKVLAALEIPGVANLDSFVGFCLEPFVEAVIATSVIAFYALDRVGTCLRMA